VTAPRPPRRMGSLCTGYGGLDAAVQSVLGAKMAWVSEYEPPTEKNPTPTQAAARVLAYRHPGVPNHGDLTVMDWSAVESVDVLTAGWPCQPWSTAGKRQGVEDDRAIWPEVARAVRCLRPRLVALENVPRVVAVGELARAVGDLAGLGYVGSWRCLRASDVGAPHRRERLFVVAAHADQGGLRAFERDVRARESDLGGRIAPDREPVRTQPVAEPRRNGAAVAGLDHQPAPDAEDIGRARPWSARDRRSGPADGGGPAADTAGLACGSAGRHDGLRVAGLEPQHRPRPAPSAPDAEGHAGRLGDRDHPPVAWGRYGPAVARWERILGRPAPAPTVVGRRGGRQLSPWFVEWMMGLPEGWVCDVPGLTRNEMLHVLGNGVLPAQAAAALSWLLRTHALAGAA
jgi:DNA (cytosine-5)-methyltransferase 1